MYRRVLLAAVAAAAAVATTLPADAASKKTTTLFFANPGDSTFTPVLQTTPDEPFHEITASIVVNGQGLPTPESYASGKKLSFKVDQSRKVTGTIHAMCQQVIGANTETQRNAGYVDLNVTIKLDKTTLGTVNVAGPVLPTMTIAKPFSFSIPAALKNKTVSKVTATVVWNTTIGMCSISYTEPGAAQIVVPVR